MSRPRGPLLILAAVAFNVTAWMVFAPEADGRSEFARQVVAETLATTAVLLFAVALLLSTRARWLESSFGGLDKVYRSHREAGAVGFLVLVSHVALIPWRFDSAGGVPSGIIAFVGFVVLVTLSIGPRLAVTRRFVTLNYRSWRRTHWLIGFFFVFSMAHMLLVDSFVVAAPVLFVIVMAAFVVGILSFLYVISIARFVRPSRMYVVEDVARVSGSALEVSFRPKSKALVFRSGQFVFVKLKGRGFRETHPFTVASSPNDELLKLVVKASGDFTMHLYEHLAPGRRARIEGAYGMLDYRTDDADQIWIAGGIGVTPFLSWLRDIDSIDRRIDFFYTVRHDEDALFVEDILRAAADPHLTFHPTISSRDGSLTVERIEEAIGGDLGDRSVFMCGPVGMIEALEAALQARGVASSSIHYEEFSFR